MIGEKNKIKIGTRGSPLALRQTEMVCVELARTCPNLEVETVVITTSGDWKPEDGEVKLNTKGEFAKEIEQALLDGEIDAAVHSMKDLETFLPEGLSVHHMLPREDVRDCLLFSNKLANNSQKIPEGSVVGTASVRRQVFLSEDRSDLEFTTLRGNVGTRIEKVREGQVDVTLLALAGLKRLGLADEADVILDVEEMLPASGQGAVGVEIRNDKSEVAAIFDGISCEETVLCVSAERGVLEAVEGSCDTPIGAYAILENGEMFLRAKLAEGGMRYEEARRTILSIEEARDFGVEIGKTLKP